LQNNHFFELHLKPTLNNTFTEKLVNSVHSVKKNPLLIYSHWFFPKRLCL